LKKVENYSSLSAAEVFLLFLLFSDFDCHFVDSHFAQ